MLEVHHELPESSSVLSEKEWDEIRAIAYQLHSENRFDGDKLRCAVAAWLIWILERASIIVATSGCLRVH